MCDVTTRLCKNALEILHVFYLPTSRNCFVGTNLCTLMCNGQIYNIGWSSCFINDDKRYFQVILSAVQVFVKNGAVAIIFIEIIFEFVTKELFRK